MKIRELIKHLETLDQDRTIYICYDHYCWWPMQPEDIEKVGDCLDGCNIKEIHPDDYKISVS